MLATSFALLLALSAIAAPARSSSALPCVGVMLPSVRGADGDATTTATSLRDLLSSYLVGPKLRVMTLDAKLAVQAIDEAREKQCEQLLVVTRALARRQRRSSAKASKPSPMVRTWSRRSSRKSPKPSC
jgi:hypothetical protein